MVRHCSHAYFIGERGDAVNAMGRCLELDLSAIEPREYLDNMRARSAVDRPQPVGAN